MLSVIIPTHDSAADLQALLAALVPAAVDGLVREVICADAGSTDPTPEICEDAGARLVQGGLVAAAGVAKGEWVLVLPADLRLPEDWAQRMGAHLARGKRPAVVRGVREPGLAARFRAVPPYPASATISAHWASSMTSIRSSAAFLSLLPAPGPATMRSVFALTEPAAFAPRRSAWAFASSRLIVSSLPVNTTVLPLTALARVSTS